MKKYNKLVRDRIPAIIEADGKQAQIEKVSGQEIACLLEEKMIEEFNEYLEAKNIEELADMMEVVFGLAHQLGYTEKQLMAVRKQKLEERGGFKQGIVLKGVIG